VGAVLTFGTPIIGALLTKALTDQWSLWAIVGCGGNYRHFPFSALASTLRRGEPDLQHAGRCLQLRQNHYRPRLSLIKELIDELQNLKLEQDEETGCIKVTHREGEHDGLAICLAAANW
jgi:hypothetical protein